MLKKLWLNLQFFADGADGDASGEGEGSTSTGEDIPAFIPEKAKGVYKRAMERTKANVPTKAEESTKPTDSNEVGKPTHIPFSDLIKSDEYKEEHKAYMDKTIGDRLKKYKGIEESNTQMKELLDLAATKYGINSESDNFIDDLRKKMEADDSFYEQYAMDNDMSTEDARKIVTLERKVAKAEAEERMRQEQMVANERNMRLLQNAERVKAKFPSFDLETELSNPKFVQLCQATNEDVEAAYVTCHWGEILPATVQNATEKAQIQTANAIASNKSRPIENGLSSNATATVVTDYSRMNLSQIREQADKWRRGIQ